jgi:hypothetical protein
MKRIIVMAAMLSLVLAATAVARSPISQADRVNAARACSALRTSLGAVTFGHQYATFGACTSQWVHTANAARNAALTACRAKNLTGKALAACTRSRTATTLANKETTFKNAAKACAAELTSLGKTAFEQKYGLNHNLRNAFGKCVSSHVKKSSSGTTPKAQHYSVTLSQLNNSGVSGAGSLLLRSGSNLTVKLDIAGLQSGQTHTIAIRGLSSGNATCPTASADTNSDGTISLSEGQPFFGDELLALDQSAAASGQSQSVSSSLLPLQTRTIVALGGTVNGAYDASLPVACGTISTA